MRRTTRGRRKAKHKNRRKARYLSAKKRIRTEVRNRAKIHLSKPNFEIHAIFLVAPDSPVHNLSFAEACPNFLLWSALYAAVLFGFCAKKGIRRPAGIALRCLYLAVAVFSVGAGIYYIAAVDVKYAPSIAFLLMYGFSLLLFLTHFLTQDRMVTQNFDN